MVPTTIIEQYMAVAGAEIMDKDGTGAENK